MNSKLAKQYLITVFVMSVMQTACSDKSDPLKTFQEIATPCETALSSPRVAEIHQSNSVDYLQKDVFDPFQVTYDVQRSASLLSPYTSYIEIKYKSASILVKSQKEAEAASFRDASVDSVYINRYLLSYAYQDNEWVLGSIQSGSRFQYHPDLKEVVVPLSIDTFIKEMPEATACLPAK